MAKFRQNHSRGKGSTRHMFRLFIIVVSLTGFILWGLSKYMPEEVEKESSPRPQLYKFEGKRTKKENQFYIQPDKRLFLPKGTSEPVTHHNYFSLAYNEDLESASWVCYELIKTSIQVPNVERSNWYMSDELITTGSAVYHDYSGSEYTRGHLAPAGDMAFNNLAMKESFVMSNMTPQLKNFNGGVWNELEQCVRDWAYEKDLLAVCTGPVFIDESIRYIGRNKVAVPHAFYKAILDIDTGEAISFLIPHAVTDLPLHEFAMSIDELESELGIDFFYNYFDNSIKESASESTVNLEMWPVKSGRYQARVNKWNKR